MMTVMTGKWSLPVLAAGTLGICVITAMAAFAVPWSWTHDQVLLLWLGLCASVILGVWVTVWLRGGNDAVTVRWKHMVERFAAGKKRFWRSLWFWSGVAVVLVFIYNMAHR
jgi:hypothetical protein